MKERTKNDDKTGAMLLEGMWKGNKLGEIIRKIEGTIMIEFKRSGNNTTASNRIPLLVGEFVYDESKESFLRNGRGYWIDEETRIATREVYDESKESFLRNGRGYWIDEETRIATREVQWKDGVKEIFMINGMLAGSLLYTCLTTLVLK